MNDLLLRLTLILILTLLGHAPAHATRVNIETPFGSFQVELLDEVAPGTVQNFLNYVNDGDYDMTFIHRSVPGFVIQGGGFFFDGAVVNGVPTDPTIVNEFSRSNLRGTLAMAKVNNDPDSADSQWFVNLTDNSDLLDTDNGGFTVFGEVVGNGMQVVDALAAQSTIWNFGSPFNELPLLGYSGSGDVFNENFVFTTITVVPDSVGFEINPGVAGAYFNAQTSGQGWFVDVIQTAEGLQLFVSWFTYDVDEPPGEDDLSFGSTHHRWFTSLGTVVGDSATMDLFRNSGGVFNDPRETTLDVVGTLTMRFIDCTTAVISFAFTNEDGGSGEIEIQRLSPDVFCGDIAAVAK